MSAPESNNALEDAHLNQPPLRRNPSGRIDVDSVPDVIQWFLDFDQRVAIIKHPRVEEVFQWKQEQSRRAGESVSEAYGLDLTGSGSTVTEAEKIPSQRGRSEFLLNCWIETLCSAEARVL